MYAHVTTYRHSTSDEALYEVRNWTHDSEQIISDASARTIASWFQSSHPRDQHMTALSSGVPFDTDELRDEIMRDCGSEPDALEAFLAWLDRLEAILSDD